MSTPNLTPLGKWLEQAFSPLNVAIELYVACKIKEERIYEMNFGTGQLTRKEALDISEYLNLNTEQQHELLEFVPILED